MFEVTPKNIENALTLAGNILIETIPNFKIPNISRVKITNASSYWANIGRDRETPNSFAIHISKTFEKIPDPIRAENRFHSCMIHEMIHTIPGCNNHGKKFKRMCSLVNKKYPKYQVQTSTSSEDYGIPRENKNPKYIIQCKECGKKYFYFKLPKYPISEYVCKCGKENTLEIFPLYNKTIK